MTTNWTDIIARNPRFRVIGMLNAIITPDADPSQEIKGKVINISRMGARFHIPAKLEPGISLMVEICQEDHDVHIRVPASVCWTRELDGDQFDIGCRLEREIGWEKMGELFLNDVIATSE